MSIRIEQDVKIDGRTYQVGEMIYTITKSAGTISITKCKYLGYSEHVGSDWCTRKPQTYKKIIVRSCATSRVSTLNRNMILPVNSTIEDLQRVMCPWAM